MRTSHESQSFGFIVAAVLLAAVAIYFFAFASTPKTGAVVAAFSMLSFAAALIEAPHLPAIEIDEEGIYDSRLGIGKVFWSEVRDFYIEETHGNRFLCLQVKRPERFMLHADRSQKQRMALHHSIGFRRINIDVKHLNVTVQDLHRRIERRLEQRPEQRPTSWLAN